MLLLTPMIAGISNKRCQWLSLRVWWHAFALHHRGETWCARMEDGKCGAQTRCHFSHFNTDFRLQTNVQESSCLAWINAISNLTESVLYWCWAARKIWRKISHSTKNGHIWVRWNVKIDVNWLTSFVLHSTTHMIKIQNWKNHTQLPYRRKVMLVVRRWKPW